MKAVVSSTGGVCIFEDKAKIHFINLNNMEPVPPAIAHLLYSMINDWEELRADSQELLLKQAIEKNQLLRVVINIESCLLGISLKLQQKLMAEVEDILKIIGNSNKITALLLKAPLSDLTAIEILIKTCLSEGFAITAHLLEGIRESQPQLRRIVDSWLSLANETFLSIPGGRRYIWRLAIENLIIYNTLSVSNYKDVEQVWLPLVFTSDIPSERNTFNKILKAMASALFPDYKERDFIFSSETTFINTKDEDGGIEKEQHNYESFTSVIKQVDAITLAVSEGHDEKAHRFLRELIKTQMGIYDGKKYILKSLCNIAQQCAEMFRSDFEYECLHKAITISPSDSWTLIQISDHYKRIGKFEKAIETLSLVTNPKEAKIAKSSLADVYVQMRQFDNALNLYSQIPDGENDPAVRCAIADILRRKGQFDIAKTEYEKIIKDGLHTQHVDSGLAEIAKMQGDLLLAIKYYEKLIKSNNIDLKSGVIYRSALAQVLVRAGEFKYAYKILDEAVQQRPFALQVRAFRAAVAGLLGDPGKAIMDLPRIGQTQAFDEWVNGYVRGLLLLMLDRYSDARTVLLNNIEQAFFDNNAQEIVRLGAVVWYLRKKESVSKADEILNSIPETKDLFIEQIKDALKYHVAIANRREAEIVRLQERLKNVTDPELVNVINAIDRYEWKDVSNIEVRIVLRLTA